MIILDLDNCIADDLWRRHYIVGDEPDPDLKWHMYYVMSVYDNPPDLNFLPSIQRSGKIIIVTSRPERYRRHTSSWLDQHGLWAYDVYMREDYDYRPTTELKLMLARKAIEKHGACVRAYDDRADVVSTYRKAGIPASIKIINTPM